MVTGDLGAQGISVKNLYFEILLMLQPGRRCIGVVLRCIEHTYWNDSKMDLSLMC